MTTLLTLTPAMSVISYVIATSLMLMSIYCVIHAGTTFVKSIILNSVAWLLIDLMLFSAAMDACITMARGGHFRTWVGTNYAAMDPSVRVVLLVFLLAVGLYRLWRTRVIVHTTITQFSVGRAIDEMPLGVMFYGDDGIILQSNIVMDKLCESLTGKELVDGADFWDDIKSGNVINALDYAPGESPVITTKNGISWMFRNLEMKSEIGDMNQFYAIDVTDEQKMIQELAEDNAKLSQMNQRLRDYNIMVDDTIRKEELLMAKMRVHDQLGEALLSARMFIESKNAPVTADGVYHKWNQTMDLLKHEADLDAGVAGELTEKEELREQVNAQIDRLTKAAEHLGIDLQMVGEMPEDFDTMQLICVGIQESLTNAFQHADADQMYVTISRENNEYVVSYSNNGNPVVYPIKEGGGLSLFREAAEKRGATVEYVESTRFKMILRIPIIG